MSRILFVDDEQNILDGLRRSLYPLRNQWDCTFSLGGEAALKELETKHFDIVVSDLRMPGIDGITLLKRVKEEHPGTIRIALSGQPNVATNTSDLGRGFFQIEAVVHQFVSKPCTANDLKQVIDRVRSLKNLIQNEGLRKVLGEIETLPILPRNQRDIVATLENEGISTAEIAKIVERDPAICAKLLKIAHSAFYGLPNKTNDIQTVVAYFGVVTVRSILLSFGIFQLFKPEPKMKNFFERNQDHSFITAKLARDLVKEPEQKAQAFIAGLLHDIGILIIAAQLPKHFEGLLASGPDRLYPDHSLEKEILGVNHAEIGAYLMGIWGLPASVVEAVTYHHEPWKIPHEKFNWIDAVYLANQMARRESGLGGEIDREYLRSVGFDGMIPN